MCVYDKIVETMKCTKKANNQDQKSSQTPCSQYLCIETNNSLSLVFITEFYEPKRHLIMFLDVFFSVPSAIDPTESPRSQTSNINFYRIFVSKIFLENEKLNHIMLRLFRNALKQQHCWEKQQIDKVVPC